MDLGLAGKVALVTGASQVADEIKKQGGTAIAFKADVANRAEVYNMVKSTLENFKAIHILVNNAAIARRAPLTQMTEEDWDIVLDVNLKGVFNCTQAVLGHMMEQRYGKIINISSGAGLGSAAADLANYASAKAGVIGLTNVTARAGGPYGINVNCIAPGGVVTELKSTQRTKEELERHIEKEMERITLGRLGKAEDTANLCLFLASDDANYITGQVITCDGGRRDRM